MTTRVQIQIKDNRSIVWKKSFSINYSDVNELVQKLNDIQKTV